MAIIIFEINSEDDKNWPEPDRIGTQELEIVNGNDHISFAVCNYYNILLQYLNIILNLYCKDNKNWIIVGCTRIKRS